MPNYDPPCEDMEFVLKEVIELDNLCKYAGVDSDVIGMVGTLLTAAGDLAKEKIEPLNKIGDVEGAKIDRYSGRVITPEGFKEAYRLYVDSGWGSLQFSEEYGGQGVPFAVAASVQEIWHSANMSWGLCPLLTQGAIDAIETNASDELKNLFLPMMVSGEWTGTMNLTEPSAGTDLGSIKTQAIRKTDHYLLRGQKIYITWGDHDMSENIVHLVLARLPNSPSGGKGLSLFLVPKILLNEKGSLGKENDLRALSLEKKIGIHACPTCVMSYGEISGAIGYLVGEENRGLECMFTMMNNARLTVGLQGVAIAERAYQQALIFCKERIQGVAPGHTESGPIIRHADVQRMLMTMKSLTEGARVLTYSACAQVDLANSKLPSKIIEEKNARLAILIPLVKAWCTEVAQEVTALSLQCHGGMGFIEDTGIAQIFRDARILPIYEGTNGIQAMDLILRKIIKDRGRAVGELVEDMDAFVSSTKLEDFLSEPQINNFEMSIKAMKETVSVLMDNSSNRVLIDSLAFDVLMMMSTIVVTWKMLVKLDKANKALKAKKITVKFYNQKRDSVLFFIDRILPRHVSHFMIIKTSFPDNLISSSFT